MSSLFCEGVLGWDLGERIQRKLGLNQAEFVEQSGLKRSTIQFWKSGRMLPSARSVRTLIKIAPFEFEAELARELEAALEREGHRWLAKPEKTAFPPLPKYLVRAIEKAAHERGLDTSYILPEVVSVWLRALSRATGKHAVKISKEAHRRVHLRS
jgi:transcriptional regulator with XRE-family HTH domain